MNSILQYYIKTSTHQAVEKIALDKSQTNPVALVGPKGTGKTTCLVAVWELCKRNSKHVVFTSTNAVRLHDTEVVRKYTRDLVKGFDKYKEKGGNVGKTTRSYVSFLYKFVNYLCISTDEKVVLLIDVGKFNTEDNDLTLQLSNLAQLLPKTKKLQVIIGFTSASGEFISDDYIYCSIQKVLYDVMVERVYFKGFINSEAETFLKNTNPCFTFNEVQPYTGCNPSLLSLTAHTNTLSKLGSAVNDAVIRFVTNNLPDNTSLKSITLTA